MPYWSYRECGGHIGEGPDGEGLSARQAGLHASCLPFLRERDVAILGNDGVQDVQPSGFGLDFLRPIHTVALVALQPYLDDLDRLGDTPFLADPGPWVEGTRVDLIG